MTLRKVSDSNGQSPVVLVNLVNFTKQSVFLFQPHWTLQHQRVETVFTHSFARESDFKMHSVRYYRVNYGIPPHIYIYVNIKIYLYTLNMYIVCILYVNICSIQLLNIYIPIQGYASKFLAWSIWTLEALVWHTWSVSWANGSLEGLRWLPKRHPPKVKYWQVLVVFTCLIVDTGKPRWLHTHILRLPSFRPSKVQQTSPTKPWCAKLHCFHLPVNLLDLTTVFFQPNLLIYGPDQILVRWRYSEKGIPIFLKGLHVGVKHLKTFLSIAADFQVFASNLAVFLIFSQLWCFFEFLWWRILRESSIMVL